MQVVKYKYNNGSEDRHVTDKEVMVLSEIGLDQIPTATEFVEYTSEKYGISQSGVWYTLHRLKEKGMLDFTEKGEEYRPLELTEGGKDVLRGGFGDRGNGSDNRHAARRLVQISAV